MGYCPIVLQKERILYCNTVIVLQRRRLEGWKLYCNTADCIARMCSWLGRKLYCKRVLYCKRRLVVGKCVAGLYCKRLGSRFVLQYKLYCELEVGLCRDTAWAGAGRAQLGTGRGAWHGRRRAALGRTGAQAAGARARADTRGVAGALQARGRGVRGAARARGRACCWANRLCTRCTQPVLTQFDSVLFLSQFLNFVRELGS